MKNISLFLVLVVISVASFGQNITIKNESSVEVNYSLPSADGPKMDVLFSEEVKIAKLVDFAPAFGSHRTFEGFMCRFMFEDKKKNTYIFYKVIKHGETFIINDYILANYFDFSRATKNGYSVEKTTGKINKDLAKR